MKRGKKYQNAVKEFDRSAQYDVTEAISLVKKMRQRNLMRQSNFISEQVVMVVMQSSRSVEPLYYHTEPVKL